MSTSDFLKHLFLSAVGSGQIKAASSPEESTRVMQNLMTQYLHAAQQMGRLNRQARKRVSPPMGAVVPQDDDAFTRQRGGALPS